MTYRSDFTILLSIRSSNNLFRPFSASLVPLELFSDCFGNAIFVFSLLKATVPSEAEDGNRYFLIARGGHDCFQLAHRCSRARHCAIFAWVICSRVSWNPFSERSKNPFRASLRLSSKRDNFTFHGDIFLVDTFFFFAKVPDMIR